MARRVTWTVYALVGGSWLYVGSRLTWDEARTAVWRAWGDVPFRRVVEGEEQ